MASNGQEDWKMRINNVKLLVIILLFLSLFSSVYAQKDYTKQKIESMDDESLFLAWKTLFLNGEVNNDNRINHPLKREISNRLHLNHTPLIESLILSEVEFRKDFYIEKSACQFQNSCKNMIRYCKYDQTYDEMIAMLERGHVLNDYITAIDLIKLLAFRGYTKAIPVLVDIAYSKDKKVHSEIEVAAENSLAIIGKQGVDLLIQRFNKWENSFDEWKEGMSVGRLSPLGFSQDMRALDIAYKYLDSDIPSMRCQAIIVLARLGCKLSDRTKKLFEESIQISDYQLGFNISAPDLTENERLKIKQILINALDDEDSYIREKVALYLRFYPYHDVIDILENCLENDPLTRESVNQKGEKNINYPIREIARKSIDILKLNYPNLFKSDKNGNQ